MNFGCDGLKPQRLCSDRVGGFVSGVGARIFKDARDRRREKPTAFDCDFRIDHPCPPRAEAARPERRVLWDECPVWLNEIENVTSLMRQKEPLTLPTLIRV